MPRRDRRGSLGECQLQASTAALHDQAEHVEETDWSQILVVYGLLERTTGNPMVGLNRAVAAGMVHGPAAGRRTSLAERLYLTIRAAHLHQCCNDQRIRD